jgi:hypothetical protein
LASKSKGGRGGGVGLCQIKDIYRPLVRTSLPIDFAVRRGANPVNGEVCPLKLLFMA